MNVQATFAATLADEWARAGVTDVVVCPGSRSTPIALAVAGDGRLRVHVVVDERSGAFFALGLGRATGRPAVVVTTSGTAAVEAHPAVVEASQDGVPLLVCTADRPPELHRVGAPQTVEQARLFADAVRWSHDPGVPDAAAMPTWRSLASRAVAEALHGPGGPGPVHLNLPFREPLAGDPGDLPPGRAGGRPWHDVAAAPRAPQPGLRASAGARGLIVAGAGAGDPAAVHALASRLGWPVLADPRSGCRIPATTTVAAADAIVRAVPAGVEPPGIVLHLGAPWASRVLNEWLASSPAEHWLVDPWGHWRDPERQAATVVAADPTLVCQALGGEPAPPEWLAWWQAAETAAQGAIDSCTAEHPATEPAVARRLLAALPDGASLVVSSSMPVRDVEWYGAPRTGVRVLANRGANGIDGVVSTALGVAAAEPGRPTVALVGDLAFLYDVGALATAARRQDLALTVVVVDNDGGGIFSFLPQARSLPAERFEALFGTPHGLDLAAVARGFGLPVVPFDEALRGLPGGPAVVHVRSDRTANVAAHAEVHDAVARALAKLS